MRHCPFIHLTEGEVASVVEDLVRIQARVDGPMTVYDKHAVGVSLLRVSALFVERLAEAGRPVRPSGSLATLTNNTLAAAAAIEVSR